jgi:L-lysine 6-transaminase
MIAPDDVHALLRRHMLVDGYDLVLDLARSRGSWLVDARDGTRYLDLLTAYASSPLGMNPPQLLDDRAFLAELTEAAINKPANSDFYSVPMAAFVTAFERVLGDPALPYLFLIEGGALAVENALKTAFDWKSRHNEAHGRDPALGSRVLHLTGAFHGRSGYTLSLTNTDPVKVERFPRFDWPRVEAPAVRFPLEANLAQVRAAEKRALAVVDEAFEAHPHDIACFLAEPIQGEGGDRHLRPEFLQAVQERCRAHDALFALDEIQTGMGLTGTPWAYQQLGLAPDVVAFGKKTQVCGIMAGGRLDEVADHVFKVSSRINSTWGGNLADMVRSRRILEVIEAEDLIAAAVGKGKHLLAELEALPVDNVRGRGLMCAFDLPGTTTRNALIERLRTEERVLILPSGPRSVRFRPSLAVTEDELSQGVAAIARVLDRLEDHR